ncbi:TOBE domain-containing protein [Hymenobacter monticola]|uniref:TOBE domain-containing protein n=1 Tax=Hymenobacter monticola TaxID=1705399 RepID=UPI0038B25D03
MLHQGRIVQQGAPAQIYRQPIDEYTAALFGDYSLVRGAARRRLLPRQPAAGALLVRPEEFRLSTTKPGLQGTVSSVRYFGNHDEVEVALPNNGVRVRQPIGQWVVGQTVFVSLVPNGGWLLQA